MPRSRTIPPARYSNTTGANNTSSGYNALFGNTTGGNNIAVGNFAGSNLTTGSNNIEIGHSGIGADSNTIRLGTSGTQTATYLAGVSGTVIGTGVPVRVSSSGKLGIKASSARFKEAIKPMGEASEAIFSLQPVTFRYRKELDPTGAQQFGLIAEQVEQVDPDLVVHDEQGKPFAVRYDAVNALLLNEFLKQHRTVEGEKASFTEFRSQLKALNARLDREEVKLQKASAASKLAAIGDVVSVK